MTPTPSVTVTNPDLTPAHTPPDDETTSEPIASYPSAYQVNQAIDTVNALSEKMKLALRHSWTNSEDVLQLDNGVAHHSTKSALRSRGLIVEGGVALTNMGKLVRAMLLRGVAAVVEWADKGRAETSIDEPDHELIGKRVQGTFSNGTDPSIEITGTVTSAYLSGEIHGFRLPMFTVQCDDGRRRFMSRGSVTVISESSEPVPAPPVALPEGAEAQPDDELIGTEVVMAKDDDRHERIIGSVIASYLTRPDHNGYRAPKVVVHGDDGRTRAAHRVDVQPLRMVEDMRLSVLLKAFADPFVTLMSPSDATSLGHAARVLNPYDTEATAPLTALVRLNEIVDRGLIPDDISGIVDEARERLAELLTAYEQANPVDVSTLEPGDLVYFYRVGNPALSEHAQDRTPSVTQRVVVEFRALTDEGMVRCRGLSGSTYQLLSRGNVKGRWPRGVDRLDDLTPARG